MPGFEQASKTSCEAGNHDHDNHDNVGNRCLHNWHDDHSGGACARGRVDVGSRGLVQLSYPNTPPPPPLYPL